ncbi:hypothetical protein D3C72_759560 [compost metagenome]
MATISSTWPTPHEVMKMANSVRKCRYGMSWRRQTKAHRMTGIEKYASAITALAPTSIPRMPGVQA